MKNFLLAVLPILAVSYSYAQNTFPATGDVGVGTSAPNATLDVLGTFSGAGTGANLDQRNLSFLQNSGRLLVGWNRTGGDGEISFLSNQAVGSVGGFAFFNYDNNGLQTQLMRIKGNGFVGVGMPNPLNKFVVNGGENNKSIEINGGSFLYDPNTHYFPALSFYTQQSGVRQAAASSEIVFSDRPGTAGYPTLARSSDMLFYTAHSYNPGTNAYGCYPDLSMMIKSTQNGGYVGIGTASPDQRLTVNGTIHATEVLVDQNVPTPDYVFNKDYDLTSLKDIKTYIDKNHHLPEIPSAAQVAKDGINLGEMNTKLLKKIEELTLYLIQQREETDTQIKDLKLQIEKFNKKNNIKR